VKTKGTWQGALSLTDDQPKKIYVGQFNITSTLHFLISKRIILVIQLVADKNAKEQGELSTVGRLDFDPKQKEFLLDKYPLVDILESFQKKEINLKIEVDESVLSSRM
jgi:hypothetical protein